MPRVDTQDGDRLVLTSDKCPGHILVHEDDSNLGERTLLLPSALKPEDAATRLRRAPRADMTRLQLFRHSVAGRQRDLLGGSPRSRETFALTARSAGDEEASLRKNEGEQILKFVGGARRAHPRGQAIPTRTRGADQAHVLMAHQDDGVVEAQPCARLMPGAGDELVVLPRMETKNIEVTRGTTQTTCQTAVAAPIALGL